MLKGTPTTASIRLPFTAGTGGILGASTSALPGIAAPGLFAGDDFYVNGVTPTGAFRAGTGNAGFTPAIFRADARSVYRPPPLITSESRPLIGEIDPEFDLSAVPSLKVQSDALMEKSGFEEHMGLAQEAIRHLEGRGIKAMIHDNGERCQVVIDPAQDGESWLQVRARELATKSHLLLFDTEDHLGHRASYLEVNSPAFKLPVVKPYVSLSWANLMSDEPTPVALHEFWHYNTSTDEGAPPLFRLQPAPGNSDGFLEVGLGEYGSDRGHNIDEFRAFLDMMRAHVEAFQVHIAEFERIVERGASLDEIEGMLDEIQLGVVLSKQSASWVYKLTHYEKCYLKPFSTNPDRVAIDVPKSSLKGVSLRRYLMKPHGHDGLDLDEGNAILMQRREVEDEGVDRTLDLGFLVEKISSVLGELEDARAEAKALEERVEELWLSALGTYRSALERLEDADFRMKFGSGLGQMRGAAGQHKEVSVFAAAADRFYAVGEAALSRMGIRYEPFKSQFHYQAGREARILPKGNHWLNRMARAIEKRHRRKLVLSSYDHRERLRAGHESMVLSWDNLVSRGPTIETQSGMIVFQHGERSKKIIQPYGSRHSYEDWGELRPNLAVMLSADDDEFSGGSGTHGLYALAHESGSYMRELRRAHGALASHDLSNEEVQALADRTLERATAGRDLWRKIVPTLQDAIRALSGAAEEEDRRLRRPRLVEEEGEPPSDAEVASQHRAEDIEHMFMENPEMLGLRPEDVRRDLITGGRSDRDRHINLPDGRRIRFSRDIINALHERIETTLSGDSYLYIENWREADWSLNFRAVAEYAQFILEPIIAFEEVFEAIIREAVRIKALVSPPASRLRSV